MKKDKIIQLFPKQDIPVEVYEWFIRMEEGGFTPEDTAEFEIWAKENPDLAAYLPEIEKAWQQISNAKLDVPAGMKDIHSARLNKVIKRRVSLWSPAYLVSGMAGVFLMLLVTGMLFMPVSDDAALPSYETFSRQRHIVTLEDGSTVQLNSSTKVVIDFSADQRLVRLQSGEAYFSVAKDSARPFIVISGKASVKAVGTAFNVKQVEQLHSAVTLVEGVVEVSQISGADRAEATATLAERGMQAILFAPGKRYARGLADRAGQVKMGIHITDVDADEVIAWKEEKLIFSGERLSTAIAKLNQHSKHQLVLLDSTVASEAIFGAFRMGDWQTAVRAIESTYPLRARRVTLNETHLIAAE